MGLKDTLFGTPTRTVLTIGGAAALIALIVKRKEVGGAVESAGESIMTAVTSAQLAGTRLLMPKGTEYLADLAFELAPKYDVSPFIVLGIVFAESDFGRALKPAGPGGTGDFIPRSPSRCVKVDAAGKCVKTLGNLVSELSFPVKTNASGQLVPTDRGWGHGLFQIDLGSHYDFIATGQWADPRAAMEYALKLYSSYRSQIKKAVPSIGPIDLVRATIAAYNAGAGNVIKALKAGVPVGSLDRGAMRANGGTRVTYSEGYVGKILDKGSALTPQNVA